MKILHIVGARPNFVKVAPVMKAIKSRRSVKQILIHTGQHYDTNMSKVFFKDLNLPKPDMNLGVGSGTQAWQMAEIMRRLEIVILKNRPDIALVYGDVNSTLAASLVCSSLKIKLGHIEAGLRSFDRSMPEEINRLFTDRLADMLFTPSADANKNLLQEGIKADKIHFVGNVMIDTLIELLPKARKRWEDKDFLGREFDKYGLVTLHRPDNVDEFSNLKYLCSVFGKISKDIPLIFPAHPRTRKNLKNIRDLFKHPALRIIDPLGYVDFLALLLKASLVMTDSGGIQEETTYLGIPCLTLRRNTERPITVTLGTNKIIGNDMKKLCFESKKIIKHKIKRGRIPSLWDGYASERIADIVMSLIKK
jgi:UDP-N-acetylglucosamine 2-epimerase (non-hydrolysing)